MANISSGQVLSTFTGTLTQGSNQITSPVGPPLSYQYYPIFVTGPTGAIPANTIINSFTTGPTAVVMNNNATAAGTATFNVLAPRIQREDLDFLTIASSSTTNRSLGWG
jgi:hypothetical protein